MSILLPLRVTPGASVRPTVRHTQAAGDYVTRTLSRAVASPQQITASLGLRWENSLRTKQRLGRGRRFRIEGEGLVHCAPQLRRREWFSQRARGSQQLGILPQIDPTGRIPAGDGDHADAGEFFLDPPQGDDSVLPRHEDVGDDERDPGLSEQLQSGVAVARFQHLVPCFLQHAAHGDPGRVVVVDYDDARHGPNLATLGGAVEPRVSEAARGRPGPLLYSELQLIPQTERDAEASGGAPLDAARCVSRIEHRTAPDAAHA